MDPYSLPPNPGPAYAGFWKRFAAYFIDYALIAFVYNVVNGYIHNSMEHESSMYSDAGSFLYRESTIRYIVMGVMFIMQWCYFAGMESSPLSATVGKLAVGIYVTDMEGKRVSFAKATGRYFGKIISGLILCIGYILAGTTEKKQALHDSMANCLVMSK